jgi:hypothetical protein
MMNRFHSLGMLDEGREAGYEQEYDRMVNRGFTIDQIFSFWRV